MSGSTWKSPRLFFLANTVSKGSAIQRNALRAPFWIGSLRISLVDYVCSNPLNARVLIPVDGHYARIWSCDLVLWVLSHESCALVWVCLLICSWYVSVVQCRLRHCECSSCNMKWSDTCATKICSMSKWDWREIETEDFGVNSSICVGSSLLVPDFWNWSSVQLLAQHGFKRKPQNTKGGPAVSLADYVCSNPLHDENETHERMFLRTDMSRCRVQHENLCGCFF